MLMCYRQYMQQDQVLLCLPLHLSGPRIEIVVDCFYGVVLVKLKHLPKDSNFWSEG